MGATARRTAFRGYDALLRHLFRNALAVAQLRPEVRKPAMTLGGMEWRVGGLLLPVLGPAAGASPRTHGHQRPKLATLSGARCTSSVGEQLTVKRCLVGFRTVKQVRCGPLARPLRK